MFPIIQSCNRSGNRHGAEFHQRRGRSSSGGRQSGTEPEWLACSDGERRDYVRRVADAFSQNATYLAEWVTCEQGKPLGGVCPGQVPGSHFEIWACETWTRTTAEIELPTVVVFENESRRDEVHRKPYGVVAAVAPWNLPLMIAVWQIIPAIRPGNTVVLKPSEYTSIASLEIARVIAIKIEQSGGLFAAQRVAAIADAAGIELYGGTMLEGAFGTVASAHLFASVANLQ